MTVFNANNAFIKAFRDARTTNRKTIITIVRVLFKNEVGGNEPDESALMKHLEDIFKKNKLSNKEAFRQTQLVASKIQNISGLASPPPARTSNLWTRQVLSPSPVKHSPPFSRASP